MKNLLALVALGVFIAVGNPALGQNTNKVERDRAQLQRDKEKMRADKRKARADKRKLKADRRAAQRAKEQQAARQK